MAARLIITPDDWETIGPVWAECAEDDPAEVARKCRVLPALVRAYAEGTNIWHPPGCVGWFEDCSSETEDDIHGFAPVPMEISDSAVIVSQTVIGTLEGEEPLEADMEIKVHANLLNDGSATIHAKPQDARELGWLLIEQADRVEAWVRQNSEMGAKLWSPGSTAVKPESADAGVERQLVGAA